MKKHYLIFALFTIFIYNSKFTFAQQYFDYGFQRNDSIIVKDASANVLSMAWAGGLNATHFQDIDINLDGIKDLVGFDIHGNRLLTFINHGTSNTIDYTYEPKYQDDFPEVQSWLQTVDYDNDGDMDLFTYSTYGAGISVYKNVSSNGHLQFQLVTQTINYYIPGWPPTNIFVSSVDYPGLVDVDRDGDMDILTFSVLGTFIYFYKNYSIEHYGVPDSLDFKLYDKCWGKFAESETTNSVYLHQYCPNTKVAKTSGNGQKHTGSTLLPIDLNNDSIYDLILGDVDYFNINGLINGGTLDSAHMISQDTTFPANTKSVEIITFPLTNYVDIDNDGVKELISSPFEGAYYKPENANSVWLYENTGTTNSPVFSYSKNNFLQGDMIDVGDAAHPALVDVDGDGLQDLIIGNYGYVDSSYWNVWNILETVKVSQLTYYHNIGSNGNPIYQLVDTNWAHLDTLRKIALSPTFGDLDGDGDQDMILGSQDGNLIYCQNTAAPGQAISFTNAVLNFQNISVGIDNFSTPQLIDIDNDTILDIVIGKKTNRLRKVNMQDSIVGYISYYRNIGTATQAVFSLETDSMGNIDPKDYWHYYSAYAVPHFFRDANDSLKLFVGSASGLTFYYRDIENNIHGTFGVDSNLTYTDILNTLYSVFSYINDYQQQVAFKAGIFSAPLVSDFNNDGYPDLMIGNFSGGMTYFKGIAPPAVGIEKQKEPINADVRLYPNPAEDYVNLAIDHYQELQNIQLEVYNLNGSIVLKKQINSAPLTQINTSSLKQGIYFIRVQAQSSDKQNFVRNLKLIVL